MGLLPADGVPSPADAPGDRPVRRLRRDDRSGGRRRRLLEPHHRRRGRQLGRRAVRDPALPLPAAASLSTARASGTTSPSPGRSSSPAWAGSSSPRARSSSAHTRVGIAGIGAISARGVGARSSPTAWIGIVTQDALPGDLRGAGSHRPAVRVVRQVEPARAHVGGAVRARPGAVRVRPRPLRARRALDPAIVAAAGVRRDRCVRTSSASTGSAFLRARNDTRPIAVVVGRDDGAFVAVTAPLLPIYGLRGLAIGCSRSRPRRSSWSATSSCGRLFSRLPHGPPRLRAIAPSAPGGGASVLALKLLLPSGPLAARARRAGSSTSAITVAATLLFERDLLREIRGYLRRPVAEAPSWA